MSRPLVVVGASGFGGESLDVVAAHNATRPDAAFEVLGVLDDAPSEDNLARLAGRHVPYLGGIDDFLAGHEPIAYLLAIGAPKVRERLVTCFDDAGWRAASVVQGLSIGADTTVGAGAVVTRTVPDGVVVKGVPGVWS